MPDDGGERESITQKPCKPSVTKVELTNTKEFGDGTNSAFTDIVVAVHVEESSRRTPLRKAEALKFAPDREST